MKRFSHIPADLLHVKDGPDGLRVVKYSHQAQYKYVWNQYPELKQVRGHVYDAQGHIVARPFDKFFNWQEDLCEIDWSKPYEVYEKLDGFLLIVYFYNGSWRINSSGAFSSEHSKWAISFILTDEFKKVADRTITYCFEGLTSQNRIVLEYPEDKVILLGARVTDTGEHLDKKDLRISGLFEHPVDYGYISETELKTLDVVGHEGFVIYQENRPVGKIKFENYVKLHSFVTRVSHRKIWEAWCTGELDTLVKNTPDEAYVFVLDYLEQLEDRCYNLKQIAIESLLEIKQLIANGLDQNQVFRYLHNNKTEGNKLLTTLLHPSAGTLDIHKPNRLLKYIKKLTYPNDERFFTGFQNRSRN